MPRAAFVEDDTGSMLRVPCVDPATKAPLNLTGATVTLKWKSRAGTLVQRTMSVPNPASGIAEYASFVAGDLYAPAMDFEVLVTDAAGKQITSLELINEPVRKRLA